MTRRGMTLVEMLVATAATLILMAAVAQVFAVFGSSLSASRATIELDGRMRIVADRLRADLDGATARPLPPLAPQAGEGYFEIIEGPRTDGDAAANTTTLHADTDDVLLFTTRNTAGPFRGRVGSAMAESSVAEVAWFLRPTPTTTTPTTVTYTENPSTYTLYRKQLLVVGVAGFPPFSSSNSNTAPATSWGSFFDQNDISARSAGPATATPNSLVDLTRRESRFLHAVVSGSFPFPFVDHQSYPPPDGLIFGATSARVGEDVVLTNVIAFDVRVFDPAAPVGVSGDAAVVAGDATTAAVDAVASGAYVDLGNNATSNALLSPLGIAPRFSGYGDPKSQLAGSATTRRTYDTWSTHYEANGLDEDSKTGFDENGKSVVDQGANGLDDAVGSHPRDGNVDEAEESETSPPYPHPLRGIEVRIRCYEPSSRQVRQVTVRNTFVPH